MAEGGDGVVEAVSFTGEGEVGFGFWAVLGGTFPSRAFEGGYTILFIHSFLIHDLEAQGFGFNACILKGCADDVVVLCSRRKLSYSYYFS